MRRVAALLSQHAEAFGAISKHKSTRMRSPSSASPASAPSDARMQRSLGANGARQIAALALHVNALQQKYGQLEAKLDTVLAVLRVRVDQMALKWL